MATQPINFDRLMQAMATSNAATADVAGFQEQRERANALRNTNYANTNNNPNQQPSWTGGLRDIFAGYRADKMDDEATKGLKLARAQLAEGPMAQARYDDQNRKEALARAKAKYDKEQLDAKTARELKAANRTEDQDRADDEWLQVLAIDPATGEEQRVRKNKRSGELQYINGDPITNARDWKETVTKTTDVPFGNSYGGKGNDRESREYWRSLDASSRAMNSLAGLSAADKTAMADKGKQTLKGLVGKAPELLVPAIRDLPGYPPAVKDVLIEIASMSAEQRHQLYGSAVTGGESMSSDEFIAALIKDGPDQLMAKLERNSISNGRNLLLADRDFGRNVYRQRLVEGNYFSPDSPIFQPSGRTVDQIGRDDALPTPSTTFDDPDEEAAYQAWKAGQGQK